MKAKFATRRPGPIVVWELSFSLAYSRLQSQLRCTTRLASFIASRGAPCRSADTTEALLMRPGNTASAQLWEALWQHIRADAPTEAYRRSVWAFLATWAPTLQ